MDKESLCEGGADKRRKEVLNSLDHARFQTYHIKALAITMVTFFSDSYLLFATSIISPMISFVYFRTEHHNGTLPEAYEFWMKGTVLVGTFVGMLFFGWYGDSVGRKRAYLPALVLMLFGTLGCTLASPLYPGASVVAVFSFYRFVSGMGIGGDYPLVGCLASEYANKRWRGAMIAAVFSMQGFGILAACLVGMATTYAFKGAILHNVGALDTVWRIVIGFGLVPVLAAFVLRRFLPESPRYTLDVSLNTRLAQSNIQALMGLGRVEEDRGSNNARRITWASMWAYVQANKLLIAVPALAWFLLDIGYYSQAFFQSNALVIINYLPAVNIDDPASVYERIWQSCTGQAIVAMMGTVPGYFFAVATIEYLGRRNLQAGGLVLMAAFLIALGFINTLANSPWAFITVYSLTMFFANAGPNTTTFVIPAELYPTRFRSTLFGICAASGKLGAIVATFGISYIRTHVSLAVTCTVLAIPVLLAASFTHMIPETCGRSLEEIQNGGPAADDEREDGGEEGGGPGPGGGMYQTSGTSYHTGPPPGYGDEDRGPEPDSCGMPLTGEALEPVYGGSGHGSSHGHYYGHGSPTFESRPPASAFAKASWTPEDDGMMYNAVPVPRERDGSRHRGVPSAPMVPPDSPGPREPAFKGESVPTGASELQEVRRVAAAPEHDLREGRPSVPAPVQQRWANGAKGVELVKPREGQEAGRPWGREREVREVPCGAVGVDESPRHRVAVPG